MKKNPQRIPKLKPYINNYNWKVIKFPAVPEEWNKIERNQKAIALNILYVKYNAKTISAPYRSE